MVAEKNESCWAEKIELEVAGTVPVREVKSVAVPRTAALWLWCRSQDYTVSECQNSGEGH